jgi:predicted DNA-binding mobile mystery protein A
MQERAMFVRSLEELKMSRTTSASSRRQARQRLDERTRLLRDHIGEFHVPLGGWLRAVREAVGMSSTDVAARIGVSESTMLRLEASERADTCQLNSLRRAAAALDCDLVYALVPRRPLEETVQGQARKRALEFLGPVQHTMLLEDQDPSQVAVDTLLADAVARWSDKPGLWNA